jgi:ribose transport system ATP-binding protein
LNNISLRVSQGEIVGISGLVGSGRTELARAIVGLDPIDSGTILMEGTQIKARSPKEAMEQGIVLIPEERKTQGLVLALSIENNISLPYLKQFSKFGTIDHRKIRTVSKQLISELFIKPSDPQKITRNLSGGNQQKVVIAKWLQQVYKVYIFDEPTRGVDVGAKVEIYRLINRIAAEGAAVIMISSDLPEILGLSDRILVMKHGEITGEVLRENANEEEVMKYAI